ncbi:MAG TPA: TadE/TadG family type IV pilus assembly protein [Urbifossiella sp.]|nr:TadE/TadG family type IV pilus assembly protein [Urbifossiella sp.]
MPRPVPRPRPPGRARRGAAAVEFAVVVPLLLLFLLGIVEVGRLVMVGQLATNGSREAARYAVQGSADPAAVEAYTRQYLAQTGIPDAAVTDFSIEAYTTTTSIKGAVATGWNPAPTLSAVPQGTPIRARFQIDYDRVSWLPTRFVIGLGTRVPGVCVMRKE